MGRIRHLINFLRVQIGKKPICPECGDEMIKFGFPIDGIVQRYKCLSCSREKSGSKGGKADAQKAETKGGD